MIVNRQTPTAMAPIPDGLNEEFELDEGRFRIPELLEDEECWVVFDHGKIPQDPTEIDPENNAIDATNPSNCVDFETAMSTVCKSRDLLGHDDGLAGIGICLDAVDDLCLIDLDDVVDDGEIEPWAVELIEDIDSWAEVSPSSEGIHVLVLDEEAVDSLYQQKDKIEVYESERYCTFSGRCLQRASTEIVRCNGVVGAYQRTHNGRRSQNDSAETYDGSAPTTPSKEAWSQGALPRDEYYEMLGADREELSRRQRRVIGAMLTQGVEDAHRLYEHGSDPDVWTEWTRTTDDGSEEPDRSRAEYTLLCNIAFWAQCADMFDFHLAMSEIEEIFLTADVAGRDKVYQRPDYVHRSTYRAIHDNGAGIVD